MTKEQVTKKQAIIREEMSDIQVAITEHQLEIKSLEIGIKLEEEDILKLDNKRALLVRAYESLNLETHTKAKVKNAK